MTRSSHVRCAVLAAIASVSNPAAASGTWQPINTPPPLASAQDPTTGQIVLPGANGLLLMTDGSIMIKSSVDHTVLKLVPDDSGSYINGRWVELAAEPYILGAGSQAVLADGRVLLEGGEFSGFPAAFTLSNLGAIYDPRNDTWQSVDPPAFFTDLYPPRVKFAPHPIGDSASVVLPDGRLLLEDKMSRQSALLDPSTLTWVETGTQTKADMNDEEGLTLLPDGRVLTVDCYTDAYFGLSVYPADPTRSEIYDPQTETWSDAGSTVNSLTDPASAEVGPAILRPDGTVFAIGSLGYTSIYDTSTHSWRVGPRLPVSSLGFQFTVKDGPAALLPNGNVLFAATGGPPDTAAFDGPPTQFFEFDGSHISAVANPQGYDQVASAGFFLLVLPTGQIMAQTGTKLSVYTPDDASHNLAWEPSITHAPSTIWPGGTFKLLGTQFNGMSQGSAYGDENQTATNYPLVRITDDYGDVSYLRTHDHSSMAVANPAEVSTRFDVPIWLAPGSYHLQVVANGIASQPVTVEVAESIFQGNFEGP